MEKEDKIKELENLLETQKCIIATQNQRILKLEETEKNMIEVFDKTDIDPISEKRENYECISEYSKNYEETTEKI